MINKIISELNNLDSQMESIKKSIDNIFFDYYASFIAEVVELSRVNPSTIYIENALDMFIDGEDFAYYEPYLGMYHITPETWNNPDYAPLRSALIFRLGRVPGMIESADPESGIPMPQELEPVSVDGFVADFSFDPKNIKVFQECRKVFDRAVSVYPNVYSGIEIKNGNIFLIEKKHELTMESALGHIADKNIMSIDIKTVSGLDPFWSVVEAKLISSSIDEPNNPPLIATVKKI